MTTHWTDDLEAPDDEDYRVLTELDMPIEWGILFENGAVVLTAPALPVGTTQGGIPISHRIRFTPHQLEVMIRRIDRG